MTQGYATKLRKGLRGSDANSTITSIDDWGEGAVVINQTNTKEGSEDEGKTKGKIK